MAQRKARFYLEVFCLADVVEKIFDEGPASSKEAHSGSKLNTLITNANDDMAGGSVSSSALSADSPEYLGSSELLTSSTISSIEQSSLITT